MCHKSGVTCHMSQFFSSLDKLVKLVGGGSVINGATLSIVLMKTTTVDNFTRLAIGISNISAVQ